MKIFLLGDSFTCNLFKEKYNAIEASKIDENIIPWILTNPIGQYLLKLNELDINYTAKWFDDWLIEWGYDVYNFGKNSCTIEDIIYQFSNLKNFNYEEGDRIIINWTHPSRFNWIDYDLNVMYIHSNTDTLKNKLPTELFKYQAVNREMSFNDGYLNKTLLPFMDYLIQIHEKYNPIVWTPFSDLFKLIENQKWFFSFTDEYSYGGLLSKTNQPWSIRNETFNVINDGHYGQYGNYYIALLFDEIIKNNIGQNYNENRDFIFENVLNRIKLENKEFTTTFN